MIKVKCAITGVEMDKRKAYNAGLLRQQLYDLIHKEHPELTKDSYLEPRIVDVYRGKYLARIIKEETGEMDSVEKRVISAIQHDQLVSDNAAAIPANFGERMADRIATFGGSWTFIISFLVFMFFWMVLNVVFLSAKAFDPYPFILLNLCLSCLAALQAPIIMMSQNRQEQKDRLRSENDYMVNLKAELEIKLLHEKVDHLMVGQHKRMLEIQQIQTDYLKDILEKIKK